MCLRQGAAEPQRLPGWPETDLLCLCSGFMLCVPFPPPRGDPPPPAAAQAWPPPIHYSQAWARCTPPRPARRLSTLAPGQFCDCPLRVCPLLGHSFQTGRALTWAASKDLRLWPEKELPEPPAWGPSPSCKGLACTSTPRNQGERPLRYHPVQSQASNHP